MGAVKAGDHVARVLTHLPPGHRGDGVQEGEHARLPLLCVIFNYNLAKIIDCHLHPPHPGPLGHRAPPIEGPVHFRIVNQTGVSRNLKQIRIVFKRETLKLYSFPGFNRM